jgi:hypothetical protein
VDRETEKDQGGERPPEREVTPEDDGEGEEDDPFGDAEPEGLRASGEGDAEFSADRVVHGAAL